MNVLSHKILTFVIRDDTDVRYEYSGPCRAVRLESHVLTGEGRQASQATKQGPPAFLQRGLHRMLPR
jgi:hypothetical protein